MSLDTTTYEFLRHDDLTAYGGGTFADLRLLHYHLWYGKAPHPGMVRSTPLCINGVRKVSPLYLTEALERIDSMPVDTIGQLCDKGVELAVAAPFYHHNMDTVLAWISCALATQFDRWLDWPHIDSGALLAALATSDTSPDALADIIQSNLLQSPPSYPYGDTQGEQLVMQEPSPAYTPSLPIDTVAMDIAKELYYGMKVIVNLDDLEYETWIYDADPAICQRVNAGHQSVADSWERSLTFDALTHEDWDSLRLSFVEALPDDTDTKRQLGAAIQFRGTRGDEMFRRVIMQAGLRDDYVRMGINTLRDRVAHTLRMRLS